MKLSFITDEVTQDFTEAVSFGKMMGLAGLELRSVEDTPIDKIPVKKLYTWHTMLADEGLEVPCLASSFYKCELNSREGELDKLQRLCDVADILGCEFIRGFAFFSPAGGVLPPEELLSAFEQPATILKQRKKKLLLESDPSVNTTNCKALAELLSMVGDTSFGAVYDPGNDLYDPEKELPYPDGYEIIKPWTLHIHVKDAVYENGLPRCVAPGTGLVGWESLIKRLISDAYTGWLSFETHYRKDVILTEEQMRLPFGSQFSNGGYAAMQESIAELRKIMEKAGRAM